MDRTELGYMVEVVEPLELWAFMDGWGDGPLVQPPGARLLLSHSQGGQVFVGPGSYQSPSSVYSGAVFPESAMGKVQRVAPLEPLSEAWMNSEESQAILRAEVQRHNSLPKIYTVAELKNANKAPKP